MYSKKGLYYKTNELLRPSTAQKSITFDIMKEDERQRILTTFPLHPNDLHLICLTLEALKLNICIFSFLKEYPHIVKKLNEINDKRNQFINNNAKGFPDYFYIADIEKRSFINSEIHRIYELI